ncbi:MAG: acyltransferase domain-containing protein [Lentisphaeria bacterium]
MNLDAVLSALHEEPLRGAFAPFWDAAQAVFPDHRPAFLQPDTLRDAWQYGSFNEAFPAAVTALADRIAGDPALLRLAWYVHWRVFAGPRESLQWEWPELRASLGDDAGLFYLTAALAFIPAVRAYHATLPLPEQVTRDTCRQVACYAANYRRGNPGRLGLYRGQIGWLATYLAPNLFFRIGRFEFWRMPYAGDYRVYRRQGSGETVVLAADNVRFTAAGDRCFAPAQPEPPGSWLSSFAETAETVTGNPVSPFGKALPRRVCLLHHEWRCVLKKGDIVLDLHIPSGGDMTPEACQSSFQEALALFGQRFPDPAPRAIVCTSWMFSEQLEDCLPPEANLVRLLRELYLVPVPATPNEGLWFVFLQSPFDAATAPRDTRLQRAILDYLGTGRSWHNGGMILLPEEVATFGAHPYRTAWPQLLTGL